jgi:glycosyltransferase involved in cell wall biosynthesis
MALGTPVVSTAVEGIPELVTAEVGACVPDLPDDRARCDSLIEAALPILHSSDLQGRLGAAARQRVASGQFSAAATSLALREVFASIVRGP